MSSGRGIEVQHHVLDLFREHNRPFSVQGVADYLGQHGIKKAQVQKTIDALVEQQKITAKEFGKTKIYWPDQSSNSVLSKEELEQKKSELKELKGRIEEKNGELGRLQKELAALNSALSMEQIEEQICDLKTRKEEDEIKLKNLTEVGEIVSQEEKIETEKALESNLKIWRRWKSSFREIWGALSENLEKKDSEMFEEIGVETDEDAGSFVDELNKLIASRKRKFR